MKNIFKSFALKVTILTIIIILPILVLFFYSKEHTFIEQNQTLPIQFNDYFEKGYTLLYVGYTGCTTVCMPRLTEISTIQRVLKDRNNKNIHYMFLDLRDYGQDTSSDFLKAFKGDFEVLTLNKKFKNNLLKELSFYFAKSFSNPNEYEHTSYLYLLEKKGNNVKLIATIMQYPFLNDTTLKFIERKVKNGTK